MTPGPKTLGWMLTLALFPWRGGTVIAHDLDFLLRALLVTEPLLNKNKLYFYRVHGANTIYSQLERTEVELTRIYADYLRAVASPVHPAIPLRHAIGTGHAPLSTCLDFRAWREPGTASCGSPNGCQKAVLSLRLGLPHRP